jgi:hypothetical protein
MTITERLRIHEAGARQQCTCRSDWLNCIRCDCGVAADEVERLEAVNADLLAALKTAIRIADEARDEWDKAPSGMRAGKLLIALSGHLKGYRPDIDSIHAALAAADPPP